jgi:hypothetical protein
MEFVKQTKEQNSWFSGLLRRVVDTDLSDRHAASIFSVSLLQLQSVSTEYILNMGHSNLISKL